MEFIGSIDCQTCGTPAPKVGFFCGKCLTQIKCKSCSSPLEKDYLGCTVCGTPKESKAEGAFQKGANTFRIHESLTERTIDASFSDTVGKDLAEILRDSLATRTIGKAHGFLTLDNESITTVKNSGLLEGDRVQVSDNNYQQQPAQSPQPNVANDYPSLLLVSKRNLPSSAVEWILVYSFYAANFGEDLFTKQNIIEKHNESQRRSDHFQNTLSRDITRAIEKGYLNILNDGYNLFPIGITKAIEIVTRTSGSPNKTKSGSSRKQGEESDQVTTETSKKPSKKTESKSLKKLNNIDFFPDGKESLQDCYNNFIPKSNNEKILVFVHWLNEIAGVKDISTDHIFTCFEELKLPVPEKFAQAIRDARSKSGWIEGNGGLNFLTIKGKNKIKLWHQ